jgi:thymidylate kinase
MKERNSRVFIIEGVQGSGKTTAVEHLSEIGCKSFRGIPSGQELVVNREAENWKQSIAILELATNSSDGSTSVMDRSIWSLVAYNIRKKPHYSSLIYELGKKMFERRMSKGISCTIVFLEIDPEISLCREDSCSVHSLRSVKDVSEEVRVYQWLMENLEKDGFNVIRIKNSNISKEEFLDLVEQTVNTTG